MIDIRSRNNEKIVAFRRLHQAKYRQEEQRFLVEGFHLIEMALKHGQLEVLLTTKPLPTMFASVEQYLVTPEIIDKLSQLSSPTSVIGVCRYQNETPLKGDKLLYLDNVNDPGNVGTIIRTALAFGFDGVALSPQTASIYNSKTIMSSQGAIFDMPFFVADYDWLLQMKKTHPILVSTLEEARELSSVKSQKCFILVLGNESHGASQEVHALADFKIKIPIQNIDSLNVAIAGAILMYHLSR